MGRGDYLLSICHFMFQHYFVLTESAKCHQTTLSASFASPLGPLKQALFNAKTLSARKLYYLVTVAVAQDATVCLLNDCRKR